MSPTTKVVSTLGLVIFCAGSGIGIGTARAQEMIPNDQSIELQLFQPAVGVQTFLTVSGAELMADKRFQAALSLTYMNGALTVYNVDPDDNLTTRTEVVKSVLAGHLTGAYGYKDKFQFGAVLPVTFAMTGDGLDPATAGPAMSDLQVTGTGDLALEFGYRFYSQDGITLAAVPQLTLPTSFGSDGSAFLGDDLPSFRPRAALEWTSADGKISAGANLGFIFRKPRTIYSSEVGQQVTYGAAGAYHVNDRVNLVAELFGRNGFGDDLDASPLEADGALRIDVTNSLTFTAGGGAGVVSGMGSPGLRVFLAVSWSPDLRDSDLDGVANKDDKCPFAAEDKDEFEDHDGCPDADNDNDLIADAEEKCPNQAEDKDGFEDDDGCPEDDNDKDGFLDEKDSCPDEAEDKLPPIDKDGCPATRRDSDDDGIADATDECPSDYEDKDGFEDENGCPDPDNDGDGILDENDTACPNSAEDLDKFEDEDGCADPDNDADGYLDAQDRCPDERETVNGNKDDDGCPDGGGKVLASLDGNRVNIHERILFDDKKATIKRRSNGMLDQVALVMRGDPKVLKWRIVVAAEKLKDDEKTRQLSQKRADAVAAYLVKKGVPADRIEALGVVAAKPTFAVVALEREETGPAPEGGETVPEPAGDPAEEPSMEMDPE